MACWTFWRPFPILGTVLPAVVFKEGNNVATAKDFVRFLVAEGWLMHYLNFSGERMLPSISKLLDQPFWLDPSDPHRMASAMQVSSRPLGHNYGVASGNWRHVQVDSENVWGDALHRVAADGVSPRAGGRRGYRPRQTDLGRVADEPSRGWRQALGRPTSLDPARASGRSRPGGLHRTAAVRPSPLPFLAGLAQPMGSRSAAQPALCNVLGASRRRCGANSVAELRCRARQTRTWVR